MDEDHNKLFLNPAVSIYHTQYYNTTSSNTKSFIKVVFVQSSVVAGDRSGVTVQDVREQ